MKMNARLGHTKASVSSEEKIFIREHFIAPQISMINFFLTKVKKKLLFLLCSHVIIFY